LISKLPILPGGRKVRFLGCVTSYEVSTGVLELQHTFLPPPNTSIIAVVDANLVLGSLRREDTIPGAWLNVLGYAEGIVKDALKVQKDISDEGMGVAGHTVCVEAVVKVGVQAIMLWNAGAVKIGQYEKAVAVRSNASMCGQR